MVGRGRGPGRCLGGTARGASVASAQDGSPSNGGGTTTSEQSKTPDSKKDSTDAASNPDKSDPGAANASDGTVGSDGTAGADGADGATAGDDVTDVDGAEQGEKAGEVIAPKNKNESDTARTNISAAHVTQPDAADVDTDSHADDHDAALAAKLQQGGDEDKNDTQVAAVQRKAVVIDSVETIEPTTPKTRPRPRRSPSPRPPTSRAIPPRPHRPCRAC